MSATSDHNSVHEFNQIWNRQIVYKWWTCHIICINWKSMYIHFTAHLDLISSCKPKSLRTWFSTLNEKIPETWQKKFSPWQQIIFCRCSGIIHAAKSIMMKIIFLIGSSPIERICISTFEHQPSLNVVWSSDGFRYIVRSTLIVTGLD